MSQLLFKKGIEMSQVSVWYVSAALTYDLCKQFEISQSQLPAEFEMSQPAASKMFLCLSSLFLMSQ